MTIKETLERLESGNYRNSQTIVLGNVPFTARDVIVKAPLLSTANVYIIGGTGEGKSELAADLTGYFGSKACQMIGRPDFEASELLREVRLDRLKTAATDSELIELTENVSKLIYYVEELNRCPALVQNYFFDFFDGRIFHRGKPFRLGSKGYNLGYATGNIGNGEYVGISDSDRALLDRMHMILKLDDPLFTTTELDDLEIFSGKKDPRPSISGGEDISETIIEAHQAFRGREVYPVLPLLGVYLTKGLDYLENTKRHSKRALNSRWSTSPGVRTNNDENKIFPLSKRAVFGAIALSSALELIAEEKGFSPDKVGLFLDCLLLTVPYSGVIARQYIDMECGGDVYDAFDTLLGPGSNNRIQLAEKVPSIEQALLLASAGRKELRLLDKIAAPTEGRWLPVRNAISRYADKVAVIPGDESATIGSIIDEAHKEEDEL